MPAPELQDRRRLRPTVEGLESLQLLSGIAHAVAAHPVHAEATKTPAAVAVVNLQGTIHSTVKVSSASLVIAGSGNLGAVGTAALNVHLTQAAPTSTFTLVTKKGQITLVPTSSTPLAGNPTTFIGPKSSTASFGYTVAGGTGAYAHATGSGTLTEAIALGKGDRITANFKFS